MSEIKVYSPGKFDWGYITAERYTYIILIDK